MAAMLHAAPTLGPAGDFFSRIFAPFSFDDVPLTLPTRTFEGRLDLLVGDRPVSLVEVGPAHTAGDLVVHLPDDGIVFTGDILFHGGHPIVWAGPVANWIAACERIIELRPTVVVPGHGPLATPAAVADLQGLLRVLDDEARIRFDGGLSADGGGAGHRPGPLRRLGRAGAAGGQRARPLPGLRERGSRVTPSHSWARWRRSRLRLRPWMTQTQLAAAPRLRSTWTRTTETRRWVSQPGWKRGRAAEVIGGRYRLRGLLGEGGMARVFDGFDERLERPVAVKILRPQTLALPGMRKRFQQEARIAARLIHPNIVAVLDYGEDDSASYLVMERLPGTTLRDEIVTGPLPQAAGHVSS